MYYSANQLRRFFESPGLSAIHFNTRSLRKHYDDICVYLASLAHHFSFICMSETWLSSDDRNIYCLPHYTPEYCHRQSNSHGGSAIFISSSVKYKRRNDLAILADNTESVWIEIDDNLEQPHSEKTILACVYRSPSSSVPEFCSALHETLDRISRERKNVVIMGDININLLEDSNQGSVEYSNCFTGFGYEQLLTLPTRCITGGSNTLIDHILSNHLSSNECGIIPLDITDHYAIFCRLSSALSRTKHSFRKALFDKVSFIDSMSSFDWSRIKSETNAELAFEAFSSVLKQCIREATTFVRCHKRYPAPHNPWLTDGLLKCMRKKDNMYKKTKRCPFNYKLQQRYSCYKNILNKLLRDAKKRYYEAKFHEASGITEQWKLINSFLNRNSKETLINEISSINGTYKEPTAIANEFNNYFTVNNTPVSDSFEGTLERQPQSFFLYPTIPEEIHNVIKKLKLTSAGLDEIQPVHLKYVADIVADPLSHVINLLFKNGTFPSDLKRAKIVPVFKKGDKGLVSNYRPIAILSVLSKVIEKCFEKRLTNYLTKFSILSASQFGFRAGYSTNLALLSFTDTIKHYIDSGKYAGAVFIDLTKAFDSILHKILITKLNAAGVVGPALNFIHSYLTDREQAVSISNHLSNFKIINRGVPQGSILGPILFTVYINDLTSHLSHCLPYLYADDTTILTACTSIDTVTFKLNSDLENIIRWCRHNSLEINPSKTVFVLFHPTQKKVTEYPSITVNNYPIKASSQCRFLGVILDANLKYTSHVSHLKQKAAYGIRILIKARPYFGPNTLLSLYYAFVHSHFTYCIASWCNTYSTHLAPLQYVQNQAIRIITYQPSRCSASAILQGLRILTIHKLFLFNMATLTYNSLHSNMPFMVFNKEQLINQNITRFASNNNLLLPKVRTNYGRFTSTFTAISVWNGIPSDVKMSPNIGSFKKRLNSYLLNV